MSGLNATHVVSLSLCMKYTVEPLDKLPEPLSFNTYKMGKNLLVISQDYWVDELVIKALCKENTNAN